MHDLRRKAPEASSALPDTKNAVALDRLFGVTTDYLLCEDEGARLAAGAREDSARGETRNISVVLGTILLVLGFAGPLALGIAASLFEAIYVGNGRSIDIYQPSFVQIISCFCYSSWQLPQSSPAQRRRRAYPACTLDASDTPGLVFAHAA